jgi:deoxyribodipyrimidine photo-lyase
VHATIRGLRVTALNAAAERPRGRYVLYWMIAARRTTWSFALEHALARARDLARPLLVLEPLRIGYRWASDRFHAFVLQGMRDNSRSFAAAGITYLPYVEPEPGHGSGLVAALARHACLVVTDEQPGFFLPRMVAAAAARLDVRMEQVDGNGILPLRSHEHAYATAMAFRRQLQRVAPPHLVHLPRPSPLADLPRVVKHAELPAAVARRWHAASSTFLDGEATTLAQLAIDHGVAPVEYRGGSSAAARVLATFVRDRLDHYADGHDHPDADASSGLSPYLHFGHISSHEVVARVLGACDWDPSRIADAKVTGRRTGWWRVPPDAESFLDELVTWRELGYGFCFHRRDYARWSALPTWARATLDAHARDRRPERYTRRELEEARTNDPVWNAAQRQLRSEGRIHNYLRMLWGKKILEWSRSPRVALATLIELNNKYSVDGRDPSSYSGILWTLGLFDRPWGPERKIFGTIRYMSSRATTRKLDMKGYLARWAGMRRGLHV